jgi:hypothetical protein
VKTAEEIREASREAVRRYKAKNRELLNEKARAYRAANLEKVREITRRSMKKAYAENPEKYKQRSQEWRSKTYAERKEMFAEWGAKRRAREAFPVWADRFIVKEMYDLARRRTQCTGIKWEVDHIVPLQSDLVCGLHVEHNLRVVPASVNRDKGNLRWPDHSNPAMAITLNHNFL